MSIARHARIRFAAPADQERAAAAFLAFPALDSRHQGAGPPGRLRRRERRPKRTAARGPPRSRLDAPMSTELPESTSARGSRAPPGGRPSPIRSAPGARSRLLSLRHPRDQASRRRSEPHTFSNGWYRPTSSRCRRRGTAHLPSCRALRSPSRRRRLHLRAPGQSRPRPEKLPPPPASAHGANVAGGPVD